MCECSAEGKTHLVVPAIEQLDAHDGKDEPEDETHQQHVHNGGDGSHQGVHHNLRGRQRASLLGSP